jgi:hypothetical protein
MSLKRFTLPFVCVLLVLGWVGAAGAQQTYILGAGSGQQVQIGGGLPLPIQLTDGPDGGTTPDWGLSGPAASMGPGAKVYPPLLIKRAHPFVTVMGAGAAGPGQKLTIPTGVLSRPPEYNILGVNAQNNKLYAVATNLGFKWPAAQATFMQRTMTPKIGGTINFFTSTPDRVYKVTLAPGSRVVTYKNTMASPFGGVARGNISTVKGSGIKPSLAVTVYGIAKIPTGNPPCTHPFFLGGVGGNPACAAALLKAIPAPTGVIGATALFTTTTAGGALPGKNVAIVKATGTPKGTIKAALLAATNTAVPTNMVTGSTGFFWTTGRLALHATGAVGTPEHWVISGSDMRTAGGAGTVSLVSGSLSLRMSSGPNANRGWVVLVLSDPDKVPSISEVGLAVLVVLLLGIAVAAQLRLRRSSATA